MKFIGALAFTVIAAWLAAAAPAAAGTFDFSGIGTADGDELDGGAIVTSDAWFAFATASDFSMRDLTYFVRYRQTADYSGDQALYAAFDGGVFLMGISAKPGLVFTSITFDLGGQPDQTQSTEYELLTWPDRDLIETNASYSVDGTSGSLLTLSGINLTGVLLKFGTSQNVGLRSVSYTTALVSPVPVPGALVLFGSGLVGLGVLAGRRRAQS